jgi:tRNA (guanine37-N1)-methyltransferase
MNFHIITIFPDIFESYFGEGMLKRAKEKGLINIKTYNLRDWTSDKHKSVDDTPFGGGAGMLMKVEPLYKAIRDLKKKIGSTRIKTVLLSAKGKKWQQSEALSYSQNIDDLILVCGRYEGVDERVLNWIDEEISIGDYVLTGGEIGAMVLLDSVSRLLPGVLGNEESSISESHSAPGLLEHPQYTRPEIFVDDQGKEYGVPKELLSGNHALIAKWKKDNNSQLK